MPICFGPQEMRVAATLDARSVRVVNIGASCKSEAVRHGIAEHPSFAHGSLVRLT
jgi:hypothetical protein